MSSLHPSKLAAADLRWHCDTESLSFETTADVDPASSVLGQDTARDALMFGIECDAPGQNVFVRGPRGSGRMRMVHRLLSELQLTTDQKKDRCYVHNFARPDHPRLVSLNPGEANRFKKRMEKFADYVTTGLQKSLESEPYKSRRDALKKSIEQSLKKISSPLEKDLAANGMALVSMQQGPVTQTNIFPVVDGSPLPAEQLQALVNEKKVDSKVLENFEKLYPDFQKRLQEVARDVAEEFENGSQKIEDFNESAAKELVATLFQRLRTSFPGTGVDDFLDEVIDDVVQNRIGPPSEKSPNLTELYGVNIVLTHADKTSRPIVEENMPNIMNLMGTVESRWGEGGMSASDYRGVHGGKLLAADQGFLILDVNELISESGAYRGMMRTLRTGMLEIVPPEVNWMRPNVIVQPEPIPIKVRVILIGEAGAYFQLDRHDPDFREQFKVLADFDGELPRAPETVQQYAAVVSYICREEGLAPFHKSAIAELAEHGARIVSRSEKLTARFGRIADIAREAAFLANKDGKSVVTDLEVKLSVQRTKERASLPSRKFQELVERGTIIVKTQGEQVGQINGMAVIRSGPLTYGFPARITASIGPGSAGLINIEGRAQMSGSIHTKGFHIIGGLLRRLLDTEHPMAFSASLAFEQSYGGIDGDSASGAEICCLLSALTGIPINQSFAMTGAIDQIGNVQAIGGVNEKIEGFFDACNYFGITGDQGAIIPAANAGDLMLREDVVEACKSGKFHVYAVSTIHEALEILTGIPAGQKQDGEYPLDSLLGMAVKKAGEYWRRTLVSPKHLTAIAQSEPDSEGVPENGESIVPQVEDPASE